MYISNVQRDNGCLTKRMAFVFHSLPSMAVIVTTFRHIPYQMVATPESFITNTQDDY